MWSKHDLRTRDEWDEVSQRISAMECPDKHKVPEDDSMLDQVSSSYPPACCSCVCVRACVHVCVHVRERERGRERERERAVCLDWLLFSGCNSYQLDLDSQVLSTCNVVLSFQ